MLKFDELPDPYNDNPFHENALLPNLGIAVLWVVLVHVLLYFWLL